MIDCIQPISLWNCRHLLMQLNTAHPKGLKIMADDYFWFGTRLQSSRRACKILLSFHALIWNNFAGSSMGQRRSHAQEMFYWLFEYITINTFGSSENQGAKIDYWLKARILWVSSYLVRIFAVNDQGVAYICCLTSYWSKVLSITSRREVCPKVCMPSYTMLTNVAFFRGKLFFLAGDGPKRKMKLLW